MAKNRLTYDDLRDGEKFREQYRFVFAGAIVATYFASNPGSVIGGFIKFALGFSAIFAATYLIATASTVKYGEKRWLYGLIFMPERFRKIMYDWAVDVYALAAVLFISLFALGMIQRIFVFELNEMLTWASIVFISLAISAPIVLFSIAQNKKEDEESRT